MVSFAVNAMKMIFYSICATNFNFKFNILFFIAKVILQDFQSE